MEHETLFLHKNNVLQNLQNNYNYPVQVYSQSHNESLKDFLVELKKQILIFTIQTKSQTMSGTQNDGLTARA